jgi:DNA-directed RNA polymerase specialized sigma24 family protein
MGSVSNIQFDPACYDHPNFPYDQFVAEEAARYETAAKVTAVALATTPEERAAKADDARLIVGLYMDALRTSRPYRDAEAASLAKTPHRGGAYYFNLVAPEKSTRVGPKAKRAKSARRAKSGTQSTPTDQQGQQDAILPDSALYAIDQSIDPSLKGEKRQIEIARKRNQVRIETAFRNLIEKKTGAEDAWYHFMLKFGSSRMNNCLMDLGEASVTPDDLAQRFALKVHAAMPQLLKMPEGEIYPYLITMRRNVSVDGFNEIKEETDSRVPLLVEKEDDEGESYLEDNPLIHLRNYPMEHRRQLPKFIKGRNLEICGYIREDYTYEKIARVLSMKVSAVKTRIWRMSKTIQEMKDRGEL